MTMLSATFVLHTAGEFFDTLAAYLPRTCCSMCLLYPSLKPLDGSGLFAQQADGFCFRAGHAVLCSTCPNVLWDRCHLQKIPQHRSSLFYWAGFLRLMFS